MTKEEYDRLIDQNPLGLPNETLEALKQTPRPDYENIPYQDEESVLPPMTPYRPIGRGRGPDNRHGQEN